MFLTDRRARVALAATDLDPVALAEFAALAVEPERFRPASRAECGTRARVQAGE